MTRPVVFVALLSTFGCSGGGADPIWRAEFTESTGGGSTVGGEGGQLPADSTGGAETASGGTSGVGTGGVVSASGGAAAAGGSGGVGSHEVTGECLLIPNDLGSQFAEDNPECGVRGNWYTYNDCNLETADRCTLNQTPSPGQFFENVDGRMCTTGVTASPADSQEKELLWGAGIGLPLNEVRETGEQRPIGELPHQLIGFRFTISGEAIPEGLRVTFPTEATVETAHLWELRDTMAGQKQVWIDSAVQEEWVPEEQRIRLDPALVTSLQFEIPSKINEPIAFDFCIEALTTLY